MRDRLVTMPLSTHNKNTGKNADIHASSGIRTLNHSVRTGEVNIFAALST
jgi:hypothetical protein